MIKFRVLAVAWVVLACQSNKQTDGIQPATDTTAGMPAVEPATPRPRPPGEVTPINVPQRADVREVTIRQLLDSDSLVGVQVRVSGRCLGYSAQIAVGSPPLTRSDWQLEDGEVAIYVSGPLPSGCSATAGSSDRITVTAIVAQDTLSPLGNRRAMPRRYLVRVVR